jgi:hypothetical protein
MLLPCSGVVKEVATGFETKARPVRLYSVEGMTMAGRRSWSDLGHLLFFAAAVAVFLKVLIPASSDPRKSLQPAILPNAMPKLTVSSSARMVPFPPVKPRLSPAETAREQKRQEMALMWSLIGEDGQKEEYAMVNGTKIPVKVLRDAYNASRVGRSGMSGYHAVRWGPRDWQPPQNFR